MVPLPVPGAEVCAVAKRDLAVGETFDAIGETCYRSWTMTVTDPATQRAIPVGCSKAASHRPGEKRRPADRRKRHARHPTRLYALRQKQDAMRESSLLVLSRSSRGGDHAKRGGGGDPTLSASALATCDTQSSVCRYSASRSRDDDEDDRQRAELRRDIARSPPFSITLRTMSRKCVAGHPRPQSPAPPGIPAKREHEAGQDDRRRIVKKLSCIACIWLRAAVEMRKPSAR